MAIPPPTQLKDVPDTTGYGDLDATHVSQLVRRDSGYAEYAVPIDWSAFDNPLYAVTLSNKQGNHFLIKNPDGSPLLDCSQGRVFYNGSRIVALNTADTLQNKTLDGTNHIDGASLNAGSVANAALASGTRYLRGTSGGELDSKRVIAGTTTVTWTGNDDAPDTVVNFPTALGSTPIVAVTVEDDTYQMAYRIHSVGGTGFWFQAKCYPSTSVPPSGHTTKIHWIAIG